MMRCGIRAFIDRIMAAVPCGRCVPALLDTGETPSMKRCVCA